MLVVIDGTEDCELTSSLIHQQCVLGDQLSLCVDHEHEDPSNDACHDEHGFS